MTSLFSRFGVTARNLARIAMLSTVLLAACLTSSAQSRQTYTVKAGDTLYRIAVNNNLSVQELQALNGITGTAIKVGQVLRLTPAEAGAAMPTDSAVPDSTMVPAESVGAMLTDSEMLDSTTVSAESGAEISTPVTGRVEPVYDDDGALSYGSVRLAPGQSFFDLAFGLGVSVDTLRQMNPDHNQVLADGAPIRVPARFAASSYRVQAGDTLYKIAAEHGISLGQLYQANPGLSERIRVGQDIRIPSGSSPADAQLPIVIAEGAASVYPARFAGRLMASGAEYDEAKHTIAHPTLGFGTIVMIENAESGARTFAEVADRMPVTTDFVVEVSRAVSDAIDLEGGNVRVRIIHSNN